MNYNRLIIAQQAVNIIRIQLFVSLIIYQKHSITNQFLIIRPYYLMGSPQARHRRILIVSDEAKEAQLGSVPLVY